MKHIDTYITEKLKLNKDSSTRYNYHPKNKDELENLVIKLCKERGKDADLNDIDVSEIKDMSFLFTGVDPHNIDISQWDVSNVENTIGMFNQCTYFNCDLSHWDVSNVKTMFWMFDGCENFDSDLSDWNVSNVKDMTDMFNNCDSLRKTPGWYKK